MEEIKYKQTQKHTQRNTNTKTKLITHPHNLKHKYIDTCRQRDQLKPTHMQGYKHTPKKNTHTHAYRYADKKYTGSQNNIHLIASTYEHIDTSSYKHTKP